MITIFTPETGLKEVRFFICFKKFTEFLFSFFFWEGEFILLYSFCKIYQVLLRNLRWKALLKYEFISLYLYPTLLCYFLLLNSKLLQSWQHTATLIYHLIVYSSCSVDQKTWWVQLDSLPRFSQGWNKGVGQIGLLPGKLGEQSTSKFIQIVGKIQFL